MKKSGIKSKATVPAEFKIVSLRECPFDGSVMDNPPTFVRFWRESVTAASWYRREQECFCVFFLNVKKYLIGFELVSLGLLDTVTIHPRETFKPAIVHNAAAILVGHNHPSGNPSPSEADIKATRDLIRAGQLLKIEVQDHIIIGDPHASGGSERGFASLRELGYFYSDFSAPKAKRASARN